MQDVYSYWMGQLKRAKKMIPLDDWKKAEERLSACEKDDNGKDIEPVVNNFRNHYEGLRAYLDQRDPSFKVTPSSAFMGDEFAVKQAECEQKYLEYIWREQDIQKVQSRKLHSALIRNVGFVVPVFDPEKWMPGLKYIPANNVRLDPDCQGLKENMKWWAYFEDITLNDFAKRHKLKKAQLEDLKKTGKSSLDEDAYKELPDEDKDIYCTVRVWHIFLKGCAVYADRFEKSVSNDRSLPDTKTKTRYLQFAEGVKESFEDREWTFRLDPKEHLLTMLSFNQLAEGLYGPTDYKHMRRMDVMTDNVMSYVEDDAFYSSIRKWLAGDSVPDDSVLNDFLNKTHRSVLPNMLDEAGHPKLVETSLRQPNGALIQQYELMESAGNKASGQNELMAETIADFKEVTAIGVRFQEQKLHQRVNLRLGGPDGYEKSIQEDAVKLLEIAHQIVPRYSDILVDIPSPYYDEQTGEIVEEGQQIQTLPWENAKQAILNGGQLLKLGVDAIVGPELAEYWTTTDDTPFEEIRLSTKVAVVPGSTRTITSQQKGVEMEDFYINTLYPTIYQPMNRLDLAVQYLMRVGALKEIDNIEDLLPTKEAIEQFNQQMMQAQQSQQEDMQRQAEIEQVRQEMDLQNQAVKNELDLQKEKEKIELQREQASIKRTQNASI